MSIHLVFDTLQAAILVAVIFCAGATLQAIEVLSEYFVNRGPIFDAAFGGKLLSIVLLVILAVIFYLLHYVVRALRTGWRPRSRAAAGALSVLPFLDRLGMRICRSFPRKRESRKRVCR